MTISKSILRTTFIQHLSISVNVELEPLDALGGGLRHFLNATRADGAQNEDSACRLRSSCGSQLALWVGHPLHDKVL